MHKLCNNCPEHDRAVGLLIVFMSWQNALLTGLPVQASLSPGRLGLGLRAHRGTHRGWKNCPPVWKIVEDSLEQARRSRHAHTRFPAVPDSPGLVYSSGAEESARAVEGIMAGYASETWEVENADKCVGIPRLRSNPFLLTCIFVNAAPASLREHCFPQVVDAAHGCQSISKI